MVWNAPESDVLSIGEVFQFEREWFPEAMGFVPCAACHELPARAYLRGVGDTQMCIPCSGYERDGRTPVVSRARRPYAYAGERPESFLTTWYH